MSSSADDEDAICIDAPDAPSRRYTIHLPPSDIDSCVGFSLLRYVLSMIGLLLALTDVPRTGLGWSSLEDYFEVVGLDTVMYFGPYAYPVAHFYKNDSIYQATSGGASIESVDLWAYKFDSLSIPTRALAQHLNVSAYPRCVLYLEPCAREAVSLGSAFVMLDALIDAFTATYAPPTSKRQSLAPLPLKFVTISRWVDRLHHFLVKQILMQTELRTHFVQYYDASSHQLRSNVCDPKAPDAEQSSAARPTVCDLAVVWNCDHPELGVDTQVPIWDHIAIRVAALRRQYPDLELDLTMISSRMVLRNHDWVIIPSVAFATDTFEISTLIRGRNCSSSSSPASCTTVFVDDYRYERATFVSDAGQWWFFAALLRGSGQVFVWARFALLWLGCYRARAAEKKLQSAAWRSKVYATWLTVAKIPSHILIYGSWFPICCYVFAHYLDCALIHLISNTVWSSINGVVRFEPVHYVKIASIQMRNLWFVALSVRLLMAGYQFCSEPRQRRWTRRNGVVGIRAILFGAISSLTVFSCFRARGFRDSAIESIDILSEQIPLRGSLAFGLGNTTEFGFRFDLKTLAIAVAVVLVLIPFAQPLNWFFTGNQCLAITCHSYYVPHSAENVWSDGSLLVYWRMRLSEKPPRPSRRHSESSRFSALFSNRVAPASMVTTTPTPSPRKNATGGWCQICHRAGRYQQLKSRWQAVQGCASHDSLQDIATRRKEHWSAVRLMNIAMMTDPIVLARLYLVGQQVFIYRVKSPSSEIEASDRLACNGAGAESSHISTLRRVPGARSIGLGKLYVLPYVLRDTLDAATESRSDGAAAAAGDCELVGSTNSSLLPWTVLVNCG